MAEDKVYDDSAYYAQQYGQQIHQPLLVCTCIAWCCLGFYFTGWVKVFHAVVWFFMLVSVRADYARRR